MRIPFSSYNDNRSPGHRWTAELVAALQFWAEWWAGEGADQHIPRCDKIHNRRHYLKSPHSEQSRRDGGSYKDFIVNEALQEEINL